jgi:hypothetical protein
VEQNGQSVQTIQGENFVLPVSVVLERLREHNVHPMPGALSALWNTAVNDYYRHFYRRAIPELEQVKRLYPGHPYADTYITQAQAAIDRGRDQTPAVPDWALPAGIGAGATALLGTGLALLFLAVLRRRRAR